MAEDQSQDDYKINKEAIKKVDDLMKKDQDDESLKKWKESLLGNALNQDVSRNF